MGRPAIGLLAVGLLVLVAGCGSRSQDSGTAAGSVGGAGPAQDAAAQQLTATAGDGSGQPAQAPGVTAGRGVAGAASARLVRTAEISFEVKDLALAAARVRAVAARFGGFVGSETTGLDESAGRGQSTLLLRVAEPRLDAALTEVTAQAAGKQLSRSSSSADVTGDLADLDSRVATQKASVARVRILLAKAVSLQDIVLLESELSKREAELEAVQARLAALSDQADLASLTVTLRTPDGAAAAPQRNGFLAGLDNGWAAVKASTTIVLTLLGALLPVSLVVGLLAWPLLLVNRRRAGRRPAPANQP